MMNIGVGRVGGKEAMDPQISLQFFWCTLNHADSSTSCSISLSHTEDEVCS